jgi:hypothetical protein
LLKRKHAGLCIVCGQKRNNPTVWCDRCRTTRKFVLAAFWRRRVASGLCPRCGRPRESTKRINCAACAQKQTNRTREHHARIQQERKKSGLCTLCGLANDRSKLNYCSTCAKKVAANRRRTKNSEKYLTFSCRNLPSAVGRMSAPN